MPAHYCMTRALLVVSLLCSATMADAGEPTHVSIQTLLSPQASSYQQHIVTVQGVTSTSRSYPLPASTQQTALPAGVWPSDVYPRR